MVFGDLEAAREEVAVRSHGSGHEHAVPILLYRHGMRRAEAEYNLDITRVLIRN